MKIFKYVFPIEDSFTLLMPIGAKPLHVDMQGHNACMWALVDPDALPRAYKFYVIGTGNKMSSRVAEHGSYIGTFKDSVFVWHVFADCSHWREI